MIAVMDFGISLTIWIQTHVNVVDKELNPQTQTCTLRLPLNFPNNIKKNCNNKFVIPKPPTTTTS